MKEHPILFSAPMVKAILNGRKMQTRRVVKHEWGYMFEVGSKKPLRRLSGRDDFVTRSQPYENLVGEPVWFYSWGNARWLRCPYGDVGDQLWVREAGAFDCRNAPIYRADGEQGGWKWAPSIHMPRWASRITLEITGVRVERLNTACEHDAECEGVEESETIFNADGHTPQWRDYLRDDHSTVCSAIDSFKSLWESINGKDSWAYNPWVWVIEFKRVEGSHA